MGVLYFPAHVRASSFVRTKDTSISGVTPPDRAFSVERIADHFSTGMRFRCRHLITAGKLVETSDARSSREGHKSITSRNERILAMAHVLGQSVLKRKANLSLDRKNLLGHTVRMAESDSETQFKQAFTERVKAARIANNYKQWEMAEALGMPQDKYKQYEGRSYLPHHLIGRFCILCHIDPEWLMTGRGQKPLKLPHVVATEPEPVRKPKKVKRSRAA